MFQINDILCSSHGYNCTLVSFYKVVRVTKASVVLQELESRFDEHDGYGQVGHVVPSHIERANKPFMRRISFNQYSNEYYVAISKYEYASKWDGKPVYYNSMD